jgi:nucleoside recognition membrane protein YjiH
MNSVSRSAALRLIVYSFIGIVVFFAPISIGEKTSIPLDHIITNLREFSPSLARGYALLVVSIGGLSAILFGDRHFRLISVFSLLGLLFSVMYIFSLGPEWFLQKEMAPFLFEKLVIPVSMIIPVGAFFLAFLVEFGLLEFVGVLMEPVMRRLWKTPGRSAIDAIASFVGSYSLGLLITDRMYREGFYSPKEAAIIATGFSTVSATFMVVVAQTCGLMEFWNSYFWATLFVTFVVTAVSVRIPPLSWKAGRRKVTYEEMSPSIGSERFKKAWKQGAAKAQEASSLAAVTRIHALAGFRMATNVVPIIMSVGLLGLYLAKHTPIFDAAAYLLWPWIALTNRPEALPISKAVVLGIVEMFLPALVSTELSLPARFVIGVQSVSAILFFSASIPCILATKIPITIGDMVWLWFQRTILSLLLAGLLARIIF